jgi:Holliday junction resolvase RusA-like endonuclease
MSVTLVLPRPISVNDAYRNNKGAGRGRIKTKECLAWEAEAKLELMAQRAAQRAPKPPVALTIMLPDSNGRADIGNYEKVLTDTLVDMKVIPNDTDKYVKRITLQLGAPAGRCLVTVEPMEAV